MKYDQTTNETREDFKKKAEQRTKIAAADKEDEKKID